MTAEAVLTIIGTACATAATILTYAFASGRWTGSTTSAHNGLAKSFEEHKRHTERRFEDAGKELSKAMSYVQGMEARFMREFATRDLTDERFAEGRRDRDLLRQELSAIKAEALWLRERRESRARRET